MQGRLQGGTRTTNTRPASQPRDATMMMMMMTTTTCSHVMSRLISFHLMERCARDSWRAAILVMRIGLGAKPRGMDDGGHDATRCGGRRGKVTQKV